jgi:hypothetical protein
MMAKNRLRYPRSDQPGERHRRQTLFGQIPRAKKWLSLGEGEDGLFERELRAKGHSGRMLQYRVICQQTLDIATVACA